MLCKTLLRLEGSMTDDLFPNGARFVRAALQVNPHQYLVKNNKPLNGLSEDAYNEAIIDACLGNDIRIIAVADHFAIADSMSLLAAAEQRGIIAFPGFEAATSDGVHYLCLFDRDTPVKTIERCIGACGVKSPEDESTVASIDSRALLRMSRDWPALIVAAHITSSKGLFKLLSGSSRQKIWKDENLIAVALSSRRSRVTKAYTDIIDCKASGYERLYPPAVIYARDVISPSNLASKTGWSWLKISSPSLDGLRHAFLDPDSRIRLPEDPLPEGYAHLVSLAWAGGFLDGERILLNPSLNVIVGPRGAGKSTVLESIRYVLDLEPLGAEARKAHQGFIDDVLGPGSKVTLTVSDPQREELWTIERGVHGPSIVSAADGIATDLDPTDIVGQVEIFGQHEVAELARMPEARSRLLARFIPTVAPPKRDRAEVSKLLASNREAIIETQQKVDRLTGKLERLPGVKASLDSYAKAGVREKLELEASYEREEPLLEEIRDVLDACVEEADALIPFDEEFLRDKVISGLPSRLGLKQIRKSIAELAQRWVATKQDLLGAVDAVRKRLHDLEQERKRERSAQHDEYLKRLRELKAENVDGERYLALERQKAQLVADEKRLGPLQQKLETLVRKRQVVLKEWGQLKRREHESLQVAASRVSKELSPAVRVRCVYEGDRSLLVEFLRDNTKGQLHIVTEAIENLDEDGFGPQELASACRNGRQEVEGLLGVDGKQVAKLGELEERVLLEMEELWLPSTTSVELRVGEEANGEPIWRDLEHLSTGEKATAILLVLLLSADLSAPLVIDQAEDDLDNSFIADDIVPKVRTEKHHRQFLLSTHNPNIPVLGDAEQVIRLTAEGEAVTGGRATVREGHTGSLDRPSVREVVEALEGGRAAFERRRRRYGY